MNSFSLIDTVVVKSEMDFTSMAKGSMIKESVNISTATMTPKDAIKNRKAYCKVLLEVGEKDDGLKIRVESITKFEIVKLGNPGTLREDSAKYCKYRSVSHSYTGFEPHPAGEMATPCRRRATGSIM